MSLRKIGKMEVQEASSGKEAIELLGCSSFDVILLDVMMPEEDGIITFQKIHGLPDLSPPPVIFFTAKAAPGDIERLTALGGLGVIPKPFDVSALPALVLGLLSKAS